MTKILTAVGSLTIVLAAGLALAGFSGCGHHRPGPERAERMITHHVDDALDDLKATPEQHQKVLAVKDRMLASLKALHGDHQALVKEALALWESPSFDQARALALVDARIDAMRTVAHQAV